ncbi:lysophospholipid acyltransferase family protein [Parerythrobacter jejuensis]|uniref:1-acyl-sn-glycerol-3-phosphate acyltransferase n=1 Tax=Parerythrobacter jejuensis TaxID=795812 RepID=A0A845AS01_9SPHN|nr:lysophospholipid acyltransferase family protein [Parerythrobacter jejuensis]MXP31286.1 1-acyl-sn-glycerol-3-phosphate acyltransferase [Parerythrobacter jejuensis]MXP34046.1 1-acyl-sn-glycerol-3-phosphate acyltransferase [Parerythrobacter jejuensis]
MFVLRTLLFCLIFYPGSTLLVVWAVLAFPLGIEVQRAAANRWSHFHRWCVENLLGIEVVLEGAPSTEPTLYAIKHESYFEAIDMPTLFEMPVVFAKEELFRIPGWGRIARVYGLVSVARKDGAKALLKLIREARKSAAEGRPLIIFPEGTRVLHGQIGKLQSGFAGIYKMVGLQVVPVAVDSGPLYRKFWKRPGRITYRFGDPIPPGLEREELERQVAAAINALNPD